MFSVASRTIVRSQLTLMGLLGNELSLVSQIPFYKGLGWLAEEEALHCWLTQCLFSRLRLAAVMSCLQSTLTCCRLP